MIRKTAHDLAEELIFPMIDNPPRRSNKVFQIKCGTPQYDTEIKAMRNALADLIEQREREAVEEYKNTISAHAGKAG